MDLSRIKSLFTEGRYEDIIQGEISSVDPDIIEYCGLSLQKLGRFDEALEVWNQLIYRKPDFASYYNERGVCKFNMRFKHSIEDFDKAIELAPYDPYFYSCRAYVRDKTGDTEGAVADYSKAHELDPEDAIVLNNLGLAEQKMGHTKKSREFFAKSDDLLGLNSRAIESEHDTGIKSISDKKTVWKEVAKMLSSFSEFKKFLAELRRGSSK
jgi:tetratricopeptide (TPR) repeat protein